MASSSRTLPINPAIPQTRGFSRQGRFTGTHYAPPALEQPSPEAETSPVSPNTPTTAGPSTSPISLGLPSPSVAARPSFSAFDEIRLESPRELKPLGLGLTGAATSETFRSNFNRFNNIPPGGGIGNLGNMSRSNSNSSASSRASVRSTTSSVNTVAMPEKPPAYTAEKGNPSEAKKGAWWSLSSWSPLMWLQLLFFLGLPTFTLTWMVSLVYFTLIPRLFASKGKALEDWVVEGVERDNAIQRQEGIAVDGDKCMNSRRKMRRWEVATAAATGLVWTGLCVVLGVVAVEATNRAGRVQYGDGDVAGAF